MNKVVAVGEILKVYQTGDRPILVLCSDGYHYICKYKQPGYSANKLACELIGGAFAKLWKIPTPQVALVVNDPIIWDNSGISHDTVAPLLGSLKMENVFDVNSFNCDQIKVSQRPLYQLLKIALFDLWIANEDRTSNNYNLLYDLRLQNIVSIDYGGIFNSGILGMPIYQLNESDSIISSDLYAWLKRAEFKYTYQEFSSAVAKCQNSYMEVLDLIPKEWGIDIKLFERKLNELFAPAWVKDTWDNFSTIVNNE